MQRWEYCYVTGKAIVYHGQYFHHNSQEQAIESLGLQGWEMVTSHTNDNVNHILFFKRPLP